MVLVDRGPTDGGCAIGSAGHLVPSHVIPLAAPGALWSAAGDPIRRNGALSVSWTTAPSFWRWIIGFARSCNRRSVESAAPALGDLASLSTEIWDQWLTGSGADVATDGLFDVYADPRAFERAGEHAELLRRWGVDVRLLDPAEALTCEPALRGPVAGGVLLPDDRCIRPGRVVADLVQRVEASGVALVPDTEAVGFVTERDRVAGVRTSSVFFRRRRSYSPPARGREDRPAARPASADDRGTRHEPDRRRPVVGPRRAMLLGEHHVAVAPLGDELRLSGWFQLNNYDTHPSAKRIARLEAIARQRLELDDSLTVRQRWAGLRPVTPDGVPIIGRLPSLEQRHDRRRPFDDRSHDGSWNRSDRRPDHRRRGDRTSLSTASRPGGSHDQRHRGPNLGRCDDVSVRKSTNEPEAAQIGRSGSRGAAHDLADVVVGEFVVHAELDAGLAGLEFGVPAGELVDVVG